MFFSLLQTIKTTAGKFIIFLKKIIRKICKHKIQELTKQTKVNKKSPNINQTRSFSTSSIKHKENKKQALKSKKSKAPSPPPGAGGKKTTKKTEYFT